MYVAAASSPPLLPHARKSKVRWDEPHSLCKALEVHENNFAYFNIHKNQELIVKHI